MPATARLFTRTTQLHDRVNTNQNGRSGNQAVFLQPAAGQCSLIAHAWSDPNTTDSNQSKFLSPMLVSRPEAPEVSKPLQS